MRVVLAYSGGLDTSFCVAWLTRERGFEVTTVTVDTGGFERAELDLIARRARAAGAVAHREVDARQAVWDGFVSTLIRGNVLRGAVYPVSVAAERTQQAVEVARVARELSADAVAHGSTGAGNDQVRFDVAFRGAAATVCRSLAPIRELGLTRERAIAALESWGLEVPEGAGRYSVNRGLWGTTLGGGWTHDPWQGPPEDAWPGAGTASSPAPEELEIGLGAGPPGGARRRPDAGPGPGRGAGGAACSPWHRARHPPRRDRARHQGPDRLRGRRGHGAGCRPPRAGEAGADPVAVVLEGPPGPVLGRPPARGPGLRSGDARHRGDDRQLAATGHRGDAGPARGRQLPGHRRAQPAQPDGPDGGPLRREQRAVDRRRGAGVRQGRRRSRRLLAARAGEGPPW